MLRYVLCSLIALASMAGCSRTDEPATTAESTPTNAAPSVVEGTEPATTTIAGEAPSEGHDCGGDCAHHGATAGAAANPAATPTADATERSFGSTIDGARSVTPLATLLARPSDFDGQTVKTEGVIAQVCQRMGCWMELRADADGPSVRVPMAGHSFFLPRDVAGRRATVEGTVEVRVLDEGTQEHLRSEGAEAAAQALGISASGVIVHGA